MPCDDPLEPHWALLRETVDIDRIQQYHFAVLLDSNHGAGSLLARRLFDELGCRATIVGGEPDGKFAHTPEPTAENLRTILPLVVASRRECRLLPGSRRRSAGRDRREGPLHRRGIHAGDLRCPCAAFAAGADRDQLLHEPDVGRFGESATACRWSAAPSAKRMSSMRCWRMKLCSGGEGSGGVIDPRVGLVRDSFVGMILLLDAMAERGMTMSQLADELPRYEIGKTQIPLPREKLCRGPRRLGKTFRRRQARPPRRPAAGLARPLASGPPEQHRTDRPRGGRMPHRGRVE